MTKINATIPQNTTINAQVNTSGKIFAQNLSLGSLTPLTLDAVNGRIGINQSEPTEALDVSGNILASGTITGASINGGVTGNVTGD